MSVLSIEAVQESSLGVEGVVMHVQVGCGMQVSAKRGVKGGWGVRVMTRSNFDVRGLCQWRCSCCKARTGSFRYALIEVH